MTDLLSFPLSHQTYGRRVVCKQTGNSFTSLTLIYSLNVFIKMLQLYPIITKIMSSVMIIKYLLTKYNYKCRWVQQKYTSLEIDKLLTSKTFKSHIWRKQAKGYWYEKQCSNIHVGLKFWKQQNVHVQLKWRHNYTLELKKRNAGKQKTSKPNQL